MTPQAGWSIVGQQGTSRYLVKTDDANPAHGRILDTAAGVLYPENLIASIAARGYWHDYTAKDGELAHLLATVADAPTAPAHEGSPVGP